VESRQRQRSVIPIHRPIATGVVDCVRVHLDGTVSAEGWATDLQALREALRLRIGSKVVGPDHAFRVSRPDVEVLHPQADGFLGAVVEWILQPDEVARPAALLAGDTEPVPFTVPPLAETAYAGFRTEPAVLGRDRIYGSGPPVDVVSHEILALARRLPPPILDFGCGAGALVRALRREGIEAYGLDLDDERIRTHLIDEVGRWITLYDGALPAPFPDERFASVACSEVIEHIPRPERTIAELARLASERLLVTVPDMSAIPRGFAHAVVPWHLLEATHINFFTQHSLERALAPVARSVEIARLHAVRCDRLQFHMNLAALVTLGTAPPATSRS
jgi:2-polyprenyl-3-methyl-5-hydroxy-6-metoxy-1,4-benzoquinol methylase